MTENLKNFLIGVVPRVGLGTCLLHAVPSRRLRRFSTLRSDTFYRSKRPLSKIGVSCMIDVSIVAVRGRFWGLKILRTCLTLTVVIFYSKRDVINSMQWRKWRICVRI